MGPSLRITAGTLRGRRVPVPAGEVRPTSERARQAYFNIIRERLDGARFLDLFAGSGIFSFEALSRGAASSLAIDKSRQNVALVEKTASQLGCVVETMTADVLAALPRLRGRAFDLVYADPPYAWPDYDRLLERLDALPLPEGSVVAVEHRRHSSPFTVEPQRLAFWRRAEYGEVWITFFTAGPAAAESAATPFAIESSEG